jgi:hypothetical protein
LRKQGANGMDFRSQIYLYIADVFAQLPAPEIAAHDVLEAGYTDLMQRAEKISRADWRRSLLENVAENRMLIEKWQQSQSARPIGP